MSVADRWALRRYQDIYRKSPVPEDNSLRETAEFYRAAEACGAPWYRIYLAESLSELSGDSRYRRLFRWLFLHCALQAGSGHLRTDLSVLEKEMPHWYLDDAGEAPVGFEKKLPEIIAEEMKQLIDQGIRSGILGRLSSEDALADSLTRPRPPLLISSDGRFIYFLRRRREEDRFLSLLDKRVQSRAANGEPATEFPLPARKADGPAAELLKKLNEGRRVVILAGGPGTGKTTNVARLIELVNEGRHQAGMKAINAALAAPTGRAAARLGAGLSRSLDTDPLSARTLHSLLGIYPGRSARYNETNPLPYQLVVVDEASMVDLPLMNALLAAMNEQAAILLVGDPDQLPSVEAGALLADLLAGEAESSRTGQSGRLNGSVVRLTETYRSNRLILDAAAAVRDGNLETLNRAFVSDSAIQGVSSHPLLPPEDLAQHFANRYIGCRSLAGDRFPADLNQVQDKVEALFALYESFTALTPVRKGPYGVIYLNQRISHIVGGTTAPFPGMPLMITRNDESRRLWNGDRGVVIKLDGRIRAVFPDSGNSYRALPLAVLPSWEPAWLQTIHKSQGSEFNNVAIILPEKAGPLLSREILYTAITRARNQVELFTDTAGLALALERRVERHSRIRRWAARTAQSEVGF